MRALYSAVSGLKANQVKMDVISNNIANSNTIGFKKSRLNFSEMMRQNIKTASSSNPDGLGGTNSIGIGLGVQIASMNTITTQGTFQNTGRALDVGIQGEGYFAVTDGSNTYYTRNGNFVISSDGSLVTTDGYRVLGKSTDENGLIENIYPLEALKVPLGQSMPPKATSSITLGNNLDASAEVGFKTSATLKVYDSTGVGYQISVDFIKTDTNGEWDVQFSFDASNQIVKDWLKDNVPNYDTLSKTDKEAAIVAANNALVANGRNSKVVFTEDGKLDINATRAANGVVEPQYLSQVSFTPPDGLPVNIDIDIANITQYSGSSNIVSREQDGNPMSVLQSVTFSDKGEVLGIFTNGFTKVLGTVVTATFSNVEGLDSIGGGYYSESLNSGTILYSKPGANGHGTFAVGCLELSNTDMSEELTDMIVTQRAYQMNSKTMMTADEMLQELMNLKR